jgi:hypothetical protein
LGLGNWEGKGEEIRIIGNRELGLGNWEGNDGRKKEKGKKEKEKRKKKKDLSTITASLAQNQSLLLRVKHSWHGPDYKLPN